MKSENFTYERVEIEYILHGHVTLLTDDVEECETYGEVETIFVLFYKVTACSWTCEESESKNAYAVEGLVTETLIEIVMENLNENHLLNTNVVSFDV